jgi:hypothetical protein
MDKALTPKPEQDGIWDPEEDLMQKILAQCENTDLSAVHAAGCCHAVGVLLLSQVYNLTQREEVQSLPLGDDIEFIEP